MTEPITWQWMLRVYLFSAKVVEIQRWSPWRGCQIQMGKKCFSVPWKWL